MQYLARLEKITLFGNVSSHNYSITAYQMDQMNKKLPATNYMVLGNLNKMVKSNFVQILALIFKVHIIWQNAVDAINLGHKENILQKKNKLFLFVNSKHVLTVLQLGDLKVIF